MLNMLMFYKLRVLSEDVVVVVIHLNYIWISRPNTIFFILVLFVSRQAEGSDRRIEVNAGRV